MAVEIRYGLELSDFILLENNLYETEPETGFNHDSLGNEILISPFLEISHQETIYAFLKSDLYWLHYFDDHDDEQQGELTSAFVCLKNKPALVCAGLQPFSVGRGLIHDENEVGISLELDANDSFQVNLSAASLDYSSSLWSFDLEYTPGFFETIDVFAAYYKAGDQAFSNKFYAYDQQTILWTTYLVDLPINSGELMYVGGGVDAFVLGTYVRLTAIAQKGQINFSSERGRLRKGVDVSAYIADLDISLNMNDTWSGSFFMRVMSGGAPENDSNDIHGYITPLPLSLRTLVFSNEQFGPADEGEGIISQSMNLFGLVSPGLSLSCSPTKDLFIKSQVSFLYPYKQPGENRSFYGWEGDVSLSWTVKPWLDYNLEAGYFRHGDVFKNEQGEKPPPAVRMITGFTVSY